MKKVAGTLKLDQAQFRELEAFAKFGSDLDAATMSVLEKGKRNVEILKQPQYSPMTVGHQVAIIYCGTNNLIKDVPVEKVMDFQTEFLHFLDTHHAQVISDLNSGKLEDKSLEVLKAAAADISHKYKA
jgi:F-type H+-transporting ATPase subunit alpha